MINFAIDPVTIAGDVARCPFPVAGFGELPGDPLAVGCAVTPSHEIRRRPWLAAPARKFGEALVERAQTTAPAHEPVVDLLVRAVAARRVSPAQPVPDNENDPADHPTVIHPRDPVRRRKIRLDAAHLRLGCRRLLVPPMNQAVRETARKLMGPEPNSLRRVYLPLSCDNY
jgi:hypothetical protein